MDEQDYGNRNRRGDWAPNKPLEVGPLLDWPWSPMRVLRWLPSYFLPWNVLFMAAGAVFWVWLTPSPESMQSLEAGWIAFILARNSALVLLLYGGLELRLYVKRRQGGRFKYNAKFPADQPSKIFFFGSQNIDNALRTFGSGLPIWTAYEVMLLWAWANGFGPWATFGDSMWWLVGFGLVLPLFHEFHFYCIHRLIHIPALYRRVHSVHHNSVNPSPWSSLSMHPVEHLLYWSGTLVHVLIPSHPLLVLYHLQISGTGAVIGHVGFDKIETGKEGAVDTHAFAHYLHHKYFEVNYADGMLPIDKWMGTWHDGTVEAQNRMMARIKKRNAGQLD
ncbi:MAG: sterol desaturase family protein [Albidovulum sp.]|nr:sterol desaturase family protein [Albidovulum sp.]